MTTIRPKQIGLVQVGLARRNQVGLIRGRGNQVRAIGGNNGLNDAHIHLPWGQKIKLVFPSIVQQFLLTNSEVVSEDRRRIFREVESAGRLFWMTAIPHTLLWALNSFLSTEIGSVLLDRDKVLKIRALNCAITVAAGVRLYLKLKKI